MKDEIIHGCLTEYFNDINYIRNANYVIESDMLYFDGNDDIFIEYDKNVSEFDKKGFKQGPRRAKELKKTNVVKYVDVTTPAKAYSTTTDIGGAMVYGGIKFFDNIATLIAKMVNFIAINITKLVTFVVKSVENIIKFPINMKHKLVGDLMLFIDIKGAENLLNNIIPSIGYIIEDVKISMEHIDYSLIKKQEDGLINKLSNVANNIATPIENKTRNMLINAIKIGPIKKRFRVIQSIRLEKTVVSFNDSKLKERYITDYPSVQIRSGIDAPYFNFKIITNGKDNVSYLEALQIITKLLQEYEEPLKEVNAVLNAKMLDDKVVKEKLCNDKTINELLKITSDTITIVAKLIACIARDVKTLNSPFTTRGEKK